MKRNKVLGDEIENETVFREVLCEKRPKGRKGALWLKRVRGSRQREHQRVRGGRRSRSQESTGI